MEIFFLSCLPLPLKYIQFILNLCSWPWWMFLALKKWQFKPSERNYFLYHFTAEKTPNTWWTGRISCTYSTVTKECKWESVCVLAVDRHTNDCNMNNGTCGDPHSSSPLQLIQTQLIQCQTYFKITNASYPNIGCCCFRAWISQFIVLSV